jgi:hypothetical protein
MPPTHASAPRGRVPGVNLRRSRRVLARIPVNLAINSDALVLATTVDINKHGGLILSPVAVRAKTVLWIQNQRSKMWAQAIVTRLHAESLGAYELGVAFVDDTISCWAEEYDKAIGVVALRPTS